MREPLCGTYSPSIDAKGRMSFPNKLRDVLGPEFYLCKGPEIDKQYIAVYSVEDFKEYSAKLYEIPGDIGGEIRRVILAGAEKQSPDKQGRIFIPAMLREYAGIEGEVTVIGNYNKAEIWNPAKLTVDSQIIDPEAYKAAVAGFVF